MSSKNAGMRRILIPSCVQIYNFPLSMYSVDGVPMLECQIEHLYASISTFVRRSLETQTIRTPFQQLFFPHVHAREAFKRSARVCLYVVIILLTRLYSHVPRKFLACMTEDVLLFEKVKSKTIKRKKH